MGVGVAECFAAAGIRVVLTDATPELTREAKAELVRRAKGHAEAGLLSEAAAGRAGTVETSDNVAGAVSQAELVFEAVPEDIGLKEEILDSCSETAQEDAVIVSNTSSLPISDLSGFVGHPGRFCGMHWFNPPEWTPGVEVIPAAATEEEIVGRLVEFLRSIGKRPAVVGDGPGFVANRIQNALFLEAVRCVEEGLASPREVDEVVRSCFGFRLPFFGPFQIADMAGLDVYENVLDVLEEGLGERFEAPVFSTRPRRKGPNRHQERGWFPRIHGGRAGAVAPGARPALRCLEPAPGGAAARQCGKGHPMIDASVLIVGAGAIGGVTAAKMEGGVRRVKVLDANEEHVEKLRDPGLLLDDLGEESRVRLDAHADPDDLEDPFDFALVTLKAPHLEAALGPLVERGLARAFVSLGNGLVQDRIGSIVGDGNLVVGTVEWGATNLGAGHLARTTRAPFVIGEPDGETKDRTRLLADALETVADVRITGNISGQVWSKLLVNSAFSGLGAVSGLLYREVIADPAGKQAALAVWREGYDVGMAQGITLDKVLGVLAESLVVRGPEDRQSADKALEVAMGYAGATKASMLQDLERGARTEVDVINGGVVERGREYGVETPLNARVVELMHTMERGERRPGRDALEELCALAD